MDNIRFALLCALGVLGFLLYQAWQDDYTTAPVPAPQSQAAAPADSASIPGGGAGDVPGIGLAPEPGQGGNRTAAGRDAGQPGRQTGTQVLAHGQTIHVVTDMLDVVIDTGGGDLRRVALRKIPVSVDKPDSAMRLINASLPNFFIVQSGLAGKEAPNHNSTYQAAQQTYRMTPGQEVLRVPLTWSDGQGHKVTKIYTFHRGSYRIGLDHRIVNNSDAPWTVSQYIRFWRTPHQVTAGIPFSSPFLGVGWYETVPGEPGSYRYETRAHDDLADNPLKMTQDGGWVAMVQHYFVGAAVPPSDVRVRYYAHPKALPQAQQAFVAGFISARKTVEAGRKAALHTALFLGPKLQDQLAATAPGLGLTVNYGWFTVVAKPMFWVLEKLHMLVGNWGVAILLLTVLIQLIFYKLSEKQYRAMARMRKFAPRMQQLKEKYGDDKQQLQSKMMELYKKEGFNPLAGCWPMLVQMPVFIAMYWVLRGAPELRFASFLWLQDLTAPDPYYVLPLIFGVTMFLQQRLQPSMTMDPMQQRMMQIMPIGMAVFFAFFPSGLVLYYSFRSVLLIAQQWYIYRKLDAEGLGHSAPAK